MPEQTKTTEKKSTTLYIHLTFIFLLFSIAAYLTRFRCAVCQQ